MPTRFAKASLSNAESKQVQNSPTMLISTLFPVLPHTNRTIGTVLNAHLGIDKRLEPVNSMIIKPLHVLQQAKQRNSLILDLCSVKRNELSFNGIVSKESTPTWKLLRVLQKVLNTVFMY